MTNAGHLPLRSKLACIVGRLVARTSRLLGKGAGGMVGGKIALRIDPDLVQHLSTGKEIVLVTGTNGKSSTTRFLAESLATQGRVAANLGGDNMTTGIVSALMKNPNASFAALEVDEMHLPQTVLTTRPKAVILLNLSRDQLDRVGEIGTVEQRIREAVDLAGDALIVANCDDPLISCAAWDAPQVSWVSVGAPWKADSTSFPRTGTLVIREGDSWRVEGSSKYSRPTPTWTVEDEEGSGRFKLVGPSASIDLTVHLPGRANKGNAAQAAIAARHLGVTDSGLRVGLGCVTAVAGRYGTYDVEGRKARMLLAKNPAGWQEALSMVRPGISQIVIAVNGQVPDGEDLSWLWDVSFERLANVNAKILIASGERAADLAVRLEYAGLECKTVKDPKQAILQCEPGEVEVLANYTAFRDLKKAIERP